MFLEGGVFRAALILLENRGSNATLPQRRMSDVHRNAAPVLDCQALDSTTIISGFTITGGSAFDGGGIYCTNSYAEICNNIITGNAATGYVGHGGGIYCGNDNSRITDNLITENTTLSYMGGGIYCYYSAGIIERNIVARNTATYGGGIFNDQSAPLIRRNLVKQNHALVSELEPEQYGKGLTNREVRNQDILMDAGE